MTEDSRISVFVINLERDGKRRDTILAQFADQPEFNVHIVVGTYGPNLASDICYTLTQDRRWSEFKGTIGCFLSHVKAWDEVSQISVPFALIIEDDVNIDMLGQVKSVILPLDAEIVFLNDRMSPCLLGAGRPEVLPLWHALKRLDKLRSGPGGDGYLLTPKAASKMLAACLKDLYYGHVDGRLLQYASGVDDLAMVSKDSWIADVIHNHHHPRLAPTTGLLRGYCLSQPLVTHRGITSSREAGDDPVIDTPNATRGKVIQLHKEELNTAPRPSMLPIRYWNRIVNIGDMLNPYIIEMVSGRRPYFSPNENAEHILGIGSIFFMANQHSHIWGSGILDPKGDYGQIAISKVHAIRGKLTEKVLREKYGLARDIPLGDPGVFANEIPEIVSYMRISRIKRRVLLIPHYAMMDNEQIQMLAKQLDADILSPRTTSLDFIKEIISSEIVISQSLHGLIFAELFQKPSAWITHSQDDLWTFKFHDWFSNTISPPKVPFPLTAPPTEILNGAQLTGLNVDKDALRHAFPSLSSSNRAPGLGFRECRRLSPLIIGITSDGRRPTSADGYDTTFHCEFGNDEMLRLLLNAYSTQFDEAMASFLIFDSSIYDGLSSAGMRRSVELLTELPSVHYFGILPATSRTASQTHASGRFNDHRFEVDAWDANFGWRGAVLIRSLVNFSFAAPGLALFRTQLEIGSREVS